MLILSILDNITNLLAEQGKKQKDLTDYLGISKNAYTDWKSGRIKSYNKHIPKIAEFFNVPIERLHDPDYSAPTKNDPDLFILDMYKKLDIEDKAEIRGTMKQMLKADKYTEHSNSSQTISGDITNDIIQTVSRPINTK